MESTVIEMKNQKREKLAVKRFVKPQIQVGRVTKKGALTLLVSHVIHFATIMLLIVIPLLYIHYRCKFDRYDLTKYREDKETNLKMESLRWLFFMLIISMATLIADVALSLFPGIIHMLYQLSSKKKAESTNLFIEQVESLRMYYLNFVVGVIGSIAAHYLFPYKITEVKVDKKDVADEDEIIYTFSWQFYVARTLVCLALGSFLLFIEKILLQLAAYKFYKTHYGNRVEENNFALSALEELSKKLEVSKTFNQINDEEDGNDDVYMEDSYEFYNTGRRRTDKLAKAIFTGLLRKATQEELVIDDFQVHLTSLDAEKLFQMLDSNYNGSISLGELKSCISTLFEERDSLFRSMKDNRHIVAQLDRLFLALASLLFVILSLSVLALPTSSYVATLGTIFFGASFIFGNVIAGMFKSIIFIFFTHPFDVGDKIVVQTRKYLIEEIQFVTTTMLSLSNNQKVYFPNSLLYSENIVNIRRSPNQSEKIILHVSSKTSNESILELEKKLIAFASDNSRDYGSVSIGGYDILHQDTLRLEISYQQKSNFQDSGLHDRRHKAFMENLRREVKALAIEYSTNSRYI